MKQRHPYCRTCGSPVTSTTVCHSCGCEPLKGNHYCSDCGTSTVAEAIMCVHCGASFQRKFPATLAILVSLTMVATMAIAGYFISQKELDPSERMADINSTAPANKQNSPKKILPKRNESSKIITNNIPQKLLKDKNDAIVLLTKKLPKNPKPESDVIINPTPPPKKTEPVPLPEEKTSSVTGRVSINSFSSRELKSYAVSCTYFEGRSKNNVVFFTTNVYGYIKINGKSYALQGVQKGNDIARFSGAGFEVTIEIEGLAGNENDWLAEATLVVKDVRQRTLSRHKVYSGCTDF